MLDLGGLQTTITRAREEIGKVIIGQEDAVRLALITILTGQHALVEGVPGVAKTLMVRTLAKVMGVDFNRIQFTPDLMPADITGTNVFDMQQGSFRLVRGPIFTTFLLGDEINRAPAKTQAALLQAMQERHVTIDRETYALSEHFTVFATQNPIEYEGTYPLPEAQKDRFLMKIAMAPPALDAELALAHRTLGVDSPEHVLEQGAVQAALTPEALLEARAALRQVSVRDEVVRYAVDIVRRTRDHAMVLVGAGPRATQGLLLAARVQAILDERDFVSPDDVKALALPVLEHRIILRPEYEIEGLSCAELVERLLEEVTVPR